MADAGVIVVGSGPAGAAAALALLRNGVPVTMLESGLPMQHGMVVRAFGRNLFRKWPTLGDGYEYTVSGDHQTLWRSGLAPGGLSNLWTGAVPRFAPEDFFEGERLHERYRWDLRAYYTQAERLLGVVGEQRSVPQLPGPEFVHEHPLPEAWSSIARHAEAFRQGLVRVPLADGPRWMVRRSGHAFNSFQTIVRGLRRYPHFHLRFGAHAVRLAWNARQLRVDAVEYVDRQTGATHRLSGSAVVLAAGPLASTKLLLQSRSADFPYGLGNTEGQIGHFLHDHPNVWSVAQLDRGLPVLDHNVYLTRRPYQETPPLLAASVTLGALSKWDRLLSLTPRTTCRFGVVTFGTTVPTYDNFVSLHPDQRDAFGLPVLDIRLVFGREVQEAINASHQGIQTSLTTPTDHLTPGWAAHFGGTVRMHASPKYGPLNAWNRLHDVDNVAVVDASCFTTGVEKNPTLTVMAIAARAADRLADDLKRNSLGEAVGIRRAVSPVR